MRASAESQLGLPFSLRHPGSESQQLCGTGKDTKSFQTEDASGSTSQAANIMEALEVGASLMLIDEDTTATNFMIRDERMQVSPKSYP